MTKHISINWSPFATNILDADRYNLCLPDGTPVDVHRDGMNFVAVIRGQRYETDSNLQMSYLLNQNEVGGVEKQP